MYPATSACSNSILRTAFSDVTLHLFLFVFYFVYLGTLLPVSISCREAPSPSLLAASYTHHVSSSSCLSLYLDTIVSRGGTYSSTLYIIDVSAYASLAAIRRQGNDIQKWQRRTVRRTIQGPPCRMIQSWMRLMSG